MTSRAKTRKISADGKKNRIETLYFDLLQALYEHEDTKLARSIAERLEPLLAKDKEFTGSILSEEIRSLIAEARGDFGEAIRCREREVRKILELHNLASEADRDYVLRRYDHSDLSDRLDLLAALYVAQGDVQQAVETLRDSKAFCAAHGIPFDGQQFLDELESQREPSGTKNGQIVRSASRRPRRATI